MKWRFDYLLYVYGMLGMLFLFYAMKYLKNDMVCYAIEWYVMLCYEI